MIGPPNAIVGRRGASSRAPSRTTALVIANTAVAIVKPPNRFCRDKTLIAVPTLVPPGEATSPRNSCRHVAARLLCCSQRTNSHEQRQKRDPAEALSIGH